MRTIVSLDDLKTILRNEIRDLQTNLEGNHCDKNHEDATERLLSRIAERNDIIRINTLRWVLEIIDKLEQRQP
jgi:hypothetical protein